MRLFGLSRERNLWLDLDVAITGSLDGLVEPVSENELPAWVVTTALGDLLGVRPEGWAEDRFCRISDRLLSESSTILAPSLCFDAGDNHFRLGLCRSTFPKALSQFDEFLSEKLYFATKLPTHQDLSY